MLRLIIHICIDMIYPTWRIIMLLPLPESVSLLCLWQGPIDPSPSITDGWVGQTCGGPGPVDKAAVSLCLPCILSPLETSALRHGPWFSG